MRILVACEESQAVTKEFRKRGFQAFSCDLQEASGGHPEWHFKENLFDVIKREKPFHLIIAHPPCTYLTNGGAVRMYPVKGQIDPERFKKAMEARDFFMAILNAECKHIAIENPMPMKCVNLPEKSQVIQPYEYGDPFSKKTYLWLKNLPKLEPTNILTEYSPYINGGGGRLHKENYKNTKGWTSAKYRSKTFKGIAEAMAKQWGDFIMDEFLKD